MAKAKKSKTRKPATKSKKSVKAKAKPGKSKKTAGSKKALARKAPAKKTAKRKQIVGEGDYAASRSFLKDQSSFVQRNKAKIPAMGKAAEAALKGPEGDALRAAEAEAGSHSRAGNEQ